MRACPRCGNILPCATHSKKAEHRGTSNSRGYTYKWSKHSKWFIKQPEHYLCEIRGIGCTKVSTRTDHRIPHRGDMALFWDQTNHQGACETCHNRKSQSERVNKNGFN